MAFVHNITLDDARAAVSGCPEFYEKQADGLIIFNYRYCNPATFPDPQLAVDDRQKLLFQIKRECRGLVFSAETEKVISRRYHKFFNIGELPETALEKLDLTRPHIFLTKYDGVLVTPIKTPEGVKFATKSGFTDITSIMEERFIKLDGNVKYVEFASHWMEKDHTPIFEWCSPRHKIVLNYGNDRLVLTGIRDNLTGNYIPHPEIEKSALSFKVEVTEAHKIEGDLAVVMEELKAKERIEGVVIKFEDSGEMYKIKTEWYFKRTHKSKQEFSLNAERNIWKLILDQEIDDALGFMNDDILTANVKEFEGVLWKALEEKSALLEEVVQGIRSLPRREFVGALKSDPRITEGLFKVALRLQDSSEVPIKVLIEYVGASLGSAAKLERAREVVGTHVRFSE
eukprot:TRINITY_DN1354_c4_g1_i1.p2 TRINITY_DN1354_c4_g1~~TRINITY_DN1354_c4_g1_i1.p2  ORF type:complete len:399 (-),score=83.32 TRINITY_DN1354_c4_g1_i1:2091-3287(-)